MRLSGRGLRCVRGERDIFRHLDFEVAAGAALAVTGPNGAGKSSLLRMIAGLLPAAEGQIMFDGGDAEQSLSEQVHYLGHRDALKPSLTARENLEFWRDFLGGDGDSAAALVRTGLDHAADLPAGFLSAGQRRRLSLARLLVVSRPVWLLDEPANALDAAGQAMMTTAMQDHLSRGGLVVAATHAPLGVEADELRLG